jgi:Integrase core domain
MMDFTLDGVKWWSLIMLDGYSRTMLAGAVAPAEASWGALMVLYTACLHYGVPETLISDSGGAFTSNAFEAVLTRLQIHHETIESTKGESYLNWMETHFNVQRRLYDYQFSLTTTPAEFEQAHQAFMALYNTTAHQGLLKDKFDPPIPLVVLGEAKGRTYSLRSSAVSFRTTSFLARRIRMAVSPCIVTTFMWNRDCPQPRCCCGSMGNSCGPSSKTWS